MANKSYRDQLLAEARRTYQQLDHDAHGYDKEAHLPGTGPATKKELLVMADAKRKVSSVICALVRELRQVTQKFPFSGTVSGGEVDTIDVDLDLPVGEQPFQGCQEQCRHCLKLCRADRVDSATGLCEVCIKDGSGYGVVSPLPPQLLFPQPHVENKPKKDIWTKPQQLQDNQTDPRKDKDRE